MAVSVGVNFQLATSASPAGYLADSGAVYANRGNGYSYGWDTANTSMRDRNVAADQRLDTLALTQLYGVKKWEIAVPNGTYRVHGVAGDPSFTDSIYKYNIEGKQLLSGTPTTSNRYVEGTATVTVTDGKLTLSNATGSDNNKIAYVDIQQIDVPATTSATYLSDLTPVSSTNGWGPYEKDKSNGEAAAGDGKMISLDGKTYAKGLGVHANSSIVYNLNGKYGQFMADIGVDDEVTAGSSVVFQVLADGKKIYDSGTMTNSTARKSISLAVAGVTQLTLVVTSAGDNIHFDHADWANARLVAVLPPDAFPAAPSNLAATAASTSQINLSWTDNSSNETGFKIERSTDGTNFAQIATVGAGVKTYANTGLAGATKYYYRVKATNAVGDSPATAVASATTQAPTVAPAAPSNLAATATSTSQINLSWNDNSSNETGFKIERSTDGTNFAQIATVGAGVKTYSNTGLAASTKYYYRVKATNSAGDSAASAVASATTQATQPGPIVNAKYVVSTTGSDSNAGSAAAPFKTVAKAMSMAAAGDTILVKNGTYRESLNLTRSGSAGKPITLVGESTAGVVFDGAGMSSVIVANGAKYITIQNITVRNARNGAQNFEAAVRTGDNWVLQDMVVEKVDGTGIVARGANVVIQRVISQDNGVAGIGGDGASNLLIKDSITRRNNRGVADPVWKSKTSIGGYPAAMQVGGLWYMSPDFEAGGGKYWACNGVTIDGLTANDNTGPGIWFDYPSSNVIIRNSKVFNNKGIDGGHTYQGNGMRIELQTNGPFLIENNLAYSNSGHNISIEQARNITIRGNTLVNSGILFRDADRGAQYAVYNISITGNQIKNGYIETWDGSWSTSSGSSKKITIDGNTYDSSSGLLFRWAGKDYTSLSSVRSSLGFEATGKTGTITVTY